MQQIIFSFCTIFIVVINFAACGDSSSNGDDTTNSSSTSNSSLSSSASSATFVSNIGEPQNSQGYYGDNVYFGGIKITGTWKIGEEGDILYAFYADGTGENDTFSGIYGVDANGSMLQTTIYRIHEFYYKSVDQDTPDCLNIDYIPSWELGTTPPIVSSKMCKISSEEE